MGRFAGTNTNTEATYSPNAITNASRVPATAPGHTSGGHAHESLPRASAEGTRRFLECWIHLLHAGLECAYNERHEAQKVDYWQDPERSDEHERTEQPTRSAVGFSHRYGHDSSRQCPRNQNQQRQKSTPSLTNELAGCFFCLRNKVTMQKLHNNAATAAIADIVRLLKKTSAAYVSLKIR